MADREAFEAWYQTVQDAYPHDPVGLAKAAWQAAVAQTARECAEICKALRDDHCRSVAQGTPDDPCTYANCDFVSAWDDAAQAIRHRFGIKE